MGGYAACTVVVHPSSKADFLNAGSRTAVLVDVVAVVALLWHCTELVLEPVATGGNDAVQEAVAVVGVAEAVVTLFTVLDDAVAADASGRGRRSGTR